MASLKQFKLPDVGEGLTEADIVRWHVRPGDVVTQNQIIVEIETAKSLVELPSPYAGTVTAILVQEGETVAVGTPIIAVGEASTTEEASEMEIDLSNPAASGGADSTPPAGSSPLDRAPRRPALARRG